jgi:hypothetical protein
MKYTLLLSLILTLLSGCLDTRQEVTLLEDGSGTFETTSDMGAAISLIRQMGGNSQLEQSGAETVDTVLTVTQLTDSLKGITDAEKQLLREATLSLKMEMKNDLFRTALRVPFRHTDEIVRIGRLSNRLLGDALKERMGDSPALGVGSDVPPLSSMDDYFITEFDNGMIKRKLDDEKHAGISSDAYLAGLKQAGQMGLSITHTWVYRLPRPVSSVEGEKVSLSDDRRTVTVRATLDDLFTDPGSLAFKVKY